MSGASVLDAGGNGEAARGAGIATGATVAADAMAEMTVFAMGSLAGGVAFAVGGGAPVCALVAPPMTIHTAKNPSATANPAPTKPCHLRGAASDLLLASTTW